MVHGTSAVSRSLPIVDCSAVLCLLTTEKNLTASQLVTGIWKATCKTNFKFGKRSSLQTFKAYSNESGGELGE